MKCFHYFRDKNKSRAQKSAPTILKNQSKSDATAEPSHERAVRSSGSAASSRSIPEIYEERAHNLRVFTFSELSRATNSFSRLSKIGEGGFGSVYRGTIDPVGGNGEPFAVAIKKLNPDGYQGHKQWVAEVQFLGVVDHPNLVKLIGYCAADGDRGIQRLLVYEYMPNRSLEDHLFSRAFPALPWDRRLRILLGAARGLAYLHEELEIQVIYRDFKASNVLLDEDFNPKISDLGLAREGPADDHTHVSTAVVGTYGYAAPDYIETGHLTSKSDVWSFGVVLYEILSGRRSLERGRPRSEQKLLDWVKQYPSDGRKFSTIMDPRLGNQYSLGAARRIAKLADSCLLKSSKDRPKMSSVVESLKQIIQQAEQSSPRKKYPQDAEDDIAGEEDEDEEDDGGERKKQAGSSESAKRRMAHLAKISENLPWASRRRFMVMQRAKVV